MAGNATVDLYDGGKTVTYDIWLQSISTSSQNEFQMQQVRNGVSWIPIRRAEMMVSFNVIWPIAIPKTPPGTPIDAGYKSIADQTDGFAKMNLFQNAIRTHQLAIANGSTDQAMVLTYKNNSDPANFNDLISTQPLKPLVYNGWIQTVDMEYARFKNVYVRSYVMNVITKNTTNPSITYLQSATNFTQRITYAPPTASDVRNYGTSWANTQDLINNSKTNIKGLP